MIRCWRNFAHVDTPERNQVRLILEHLGSETLRKNEAAQKAMHANLSAKGQLGGSGTINLAIEIIEEQAGQFIQLATEQVSQVANDGEAFESIASQLTALFRGFEPHLDKALSFSSRGQSQRSESAKVAAYARFADARSRIFKQLQIGKYGFLKGGKGDQDAPGANGEVAKLKSGDKRNSGGKPLAAHWDAMWAAIAVKLWSGELKPKSQADVKKAMLDWFDQSEIEIGDTAVTQRARQLWQAMLELDS